MLLNIGDKPLADFTDPLQMMKDCHRRIEYFLDLLRKVEQQCGDGDLTDDGRRALQSAVNYFAEFAPRHTADEESSLFPRLRQSGSPVARAIVAEVDRLEADHRTCDHGHAVVDRLVRRWFSSGCIDPEQRETLRSTLAQLAEIYSTHIELEEQQVFRIASNVLPADAVRQIGEEMRQRRAAAPHNAAPATVYD